MVAVSAIMHGIVLFSLLFLYRGSSECHIDVMLKGVSSTATVVLMPLHKTVAKTAQKKGGAKPTASTQSREAVPEKPTQKTAKPTTALAAAPVPARKERAQKQAAKSKRQAKQAPSVKKEHQELPVQEKKEPEQKPQEVTPPPVAQAAPVPEAAPVVPTEVDTAGDVTYVGRAELEALQMQAEIQQEIERRWRPPVGLAKDLLCQIRVLVDWQGAVQKVAIEQGSGVLIYDVQARNAAREIVFPKAAWGKEIVVHFNQG
ncbi:MAG TPA: TonB C-terminal domain-containing protein [Candidatus Limnocylindria bacterium]|nr:TonB C-terminal domain-containing protein [Candidatus Limnocylindria bacterium]